MTGSASRGNGGKYYYYHCSKDAKHFRCRADRANEQFACYMSMLKPNNAILALYEEIMKDINNEGKIVTKGEIAKLEEEIRNCDKRLNTLSNRYLDNEFDINTYNELKQSVLRTKMETEGKLALLKNPKRSKIEPQLEYAISLINNLEHYMREGRIDTKRELIGVMFPEKFDFDGKSYRTNSYNKVLDAIYVQTNELRGIKKAETPEFSEISTSVPRAVALARV